MRLAGPLTTGRRPTWLAAGAAIALAAVAVAMLAAPGAERLPVTVRRAAEHIAAPGEMLWWTTLGGAFAGRPTGAIGIGLWIAGTAVFWFVVFLALGALHRRLRVGRRAAAGASVGDGR